VLVFPLDLIGAVVDGFLYILGCVGHALTNGVSGLLGVRANLRVVNFFFRMRIPSYRLRGIIRVAPGLFCRALYLVGSAGVGKLFIAYCFAD